MKRPNPMSPDRMTPTERRAELCGLLALGLVRLAELAERKGIAPSYMTRVLRRTLLAPDLVEAILDGKQGPEVTLAQVLEPFSLEWRGERQNC